MQVLTPGHRYRLDMKSRDREGPIIQFVQDAHHGAQCDGVLCQEVLRCLIDRVKFLFEEEPSHETTEIILKLRETLALFEQRAFRKTLEKSVKLSGRPIELLNIQDNGHFFSLK